MTTTWKLIGTAWLLGVLATGPAHGQSPVARFIYEDAEAAFAERDYRTALSRLNEAERAFGEVNPPILYLRIQARHELVKAAQGPDFNLLDPLRADINLYLNSYGKIDALVDQMRDVYQISRALEQYPRDRVAHEAAMAAQARLQEQARQVEEARLAAERERGSQPGHSFRDCPQCPEMVVVPGGTLTVQAVDGPRQIEIRPFAISRYELTWEEYDALLGQRSSVDASYKKHPLTKVAFNPHGPNESTVWKWLGALEKKSGHRYHLPSETQWEWACRGGEQYRYCGGDDLKELAWGNFIFGSPSYPVGQKKPNGYGLYDMNGNALEGTADSWFDDFDPPIDGGPRLSPTIKMHHATVSRGGSTVNPSAEPFDPTYRDNAVASGLRLARPLQRGLLGISHDNADMRKPLGARIAAVDPVSAAAQAGLQPGDVIVEVDGRPILNRWSLTTYTAQLEAGRTVRITLLRGGQRQQVETTLAAAVPKPAS